MPLETVGGGAVLGEAGTGCAFEGTVMLGPPKFTPMAEGRVEGGEEIGDVAGPRRLKGDSFLRGDTSTCETLDLAPTLGDFGLWVAVVCRLPVCVETVPTTWRLLIPVAAAGT
mmetsp:Transcript_23984/g.44471  ORF Transcript_23984/g.44471 Transcript_23984/m.44471 type:complete len:113 (-) Transcript_23984:152-490(-)